jgi:hypothetical protein
MWAAELDPAISKALSILSDRPQFSIGENDLLVTRIFCKVISPEMLPYRDSNPESSVPETDAIASYAIRQ